MRIAIYKGKRYRLDYLGPTRYGRRAKLSFFNGRRTFWVNASMVTEEGGYGGGAPDRTPKADADPEPVYQDEFDTYAAEAAAEQRQGRLIDIGYDAYAREEGHFDGPDF